MDKFNRSVGRAIEILELLAHSPNELTITEISKNLAIPKSTAFDIIYTLVNKGYLEVADERLKSFRLGVKLFQVGSGYRDKKPFYDVAKSVLEKITAQVNETSFLAIESGGMLVYLDKAESENSVRTSCKLGSNRPMYCTGLGKALLSAYSDERLLDIVRSTGGMPPITPTTITTEEHLIEEMNESRRRGYAIDDREHNMDVFCVAAPIYDSRNAPLAAISVACLSSKMVGNPERIKELGTLVSQAALSISQRMGFTGDRLYDVR